MSFKRNKPGIDKIERLIGIALELAGETAADEVIKLMQSGNRHGRQYRIPGTKRLYRASAPGEPPAVRTGFLVNHVAASEVRKRRRTMQVFIGANVRGKKPGALTTYNYARALEYGRGRIKPRPAFRAVFEDEKAKKRIMKNLEDLF